MLSRRLLFRQQLTRLTCVITHTRCSSQVAMEPDLTGSSEVRLSAPKPKQPTREPFAKNLFLGKFDVEFLAYPEPQSHDRHREFFEWLKPIEDYVNESIDAREIDRSAKIPNQVFDELRRLGVLRAAVGESYGGLGLNNSEYTKLVETVSAVPVLGTYLVKRASVINLINKFGSEQQKSNLLPKIATDELRPALCFSEKDSGSITEPLASKAILSDCRTFFMLNGHKTWVVDATNANLFVVLAKNSSSDEFIKVTSLSAFLVPRDDKGITVSEPLSTLGQKGLDLCTVTFKDIQIPLENQLGSSSVETELFVSALGEGKHNIGGQAIGILKRFLNLLTTNISQEKNFNLKKHQDDSLHETIGKIATSLYAMEAVTYLTTGMMDTFESQDCILEQSLVESHCAEACIENMLQGIQIVGASGYWRDEPFEQAVRDVLALRACDRSGVDTKVFAALLGIQHAGLNLGQTVKKKRNPMFHPLDMVRSALKIERQKKLYLDENLHPSLRVSATSLEQSVHDLRKCVLNMFIRSGISLMTQRMELNRLTDIMIEIYAMTAVVARASRSYCIGLRNAEHEVKVAMIFTYHTYEKVNTIVRELTDGDWANGDYMIKEIAESIFQKKSYFAEHPLDRTY